MAKYKYNPKLQFVIPNCKGNLLTNKNEFTNGDGQDSIFSFWDVLKWKFSSTDYKNGRKDKDYKLKVIKDSSFLDSNEDVIVWLGHATLFIRISGVSIITDPIFASMPMVSRKAEFPVLPHEIKGIDYVLLSHAHRDHFDKKSIKILKNNNPQMEVLMPLDIGEWIQKKQIKNQEAAWWQKFETKQGVEIVFLPAKHWHRRMLTDFNKGLWGSFVIKIGGKSMFFAGDTAYGSHFKDIAELFPNIDYCIMPIGAYQPQYMMKQSHMSPWEAITAFKDIKGRTMIPMHYGTFQLADEYFGEPEEVMRKSSSEVKIKVLAAGESLEI